MAPQPSPSNIVWDAPHPSSIVWDDVPKQTGPEPATFGNTLLGGGELLGSGVANIPHAAAHAAVDLYRRVTGGDTSAADPAAVRAIQAPTGEAAQNLVSNAKGLLPGTPNGLDISDEELRSVDPTGKVPIETLRAQYKAEADKSLPQMLKESGSTAGDVVGHVLDVGADVANLAPALSLVKTASEGVGSAVKQAAENAANAPAWQKAGLRTAQNHPIARNAAGASGREALTLHNSPVIDKIAANEAGIQPEHGALGQDSLISARTDAESVYDRLKQALPTGSLDSTAASEVGSAGTPQGGRITAGSPVAQQQIEALRAQLLAPDRQFTGTQMVNELRGLRQEGFANVASEDVSNQQLGRAQLGMARALEGHIGRNIPAGADVSLEQFQGARKALAKNFTVQNALRGGNVDPQALARIYRSDPELLDGGIKTIAEFADQHPEVASLPSVTTRYNPPGLARDFSDIDLKKPLTYVQPVTGEAARRVLTGSTNKALARADELYPVRSPGQFAPIPAPPKPAIAGLLPAPAMVNAGAGATTEQNLRDIGLTPDVQAAAAAHPGRARLGPPTSASPPPPASIDFKPPENWSSVLQANGRSPAQMYAEALQDKAPEDAWFSPGNRDYADVLSQGIPQKFRDRGAPTSNNGSGESAASLEAINRGSRPLATIDADGNEHPLLGDVTQADRKAPKGNLIIDISTGEILDRGGLTKTLAEGLRNRWAAQAATSTRQRMLAEALKAQ